MKKILFGTFCAIALTISMTSCNSDIQCRYSDVKKVYEITNEQGHVTGYGMTYAIRGQFYDADIQRATYEELKSGETEVNTRLVFRYRHKGYAMYIDRSGRNVTKIND